MLNCHRCTLNMSSSTVSVRYILITGIPGVGKTTLIKKIHESLVKNGLHCAGFFTEEVRSKGHRIGFDVVTTENNRGQLARLSDNTDGAPGSRQKTYKVGQYNVDIQSFELAALPALHMPPHSKEGCKLMYLIDEIGKMELFSQIFIQSVKKLMSEPNACLIATIPVPKGRPLPLVEELRTNSLSQVFHVTHQNRDTILPDILKAVNLQISTQVS